MKTPFTLRPGLASLAALFVGFTPAASLADLLVAYDNPLIPTGLRPGESFHLVFATSNTTNRDAGGGADTYPISQWNTFVDNAAASTTIPEFQATLTDATWYAIVSTTLVDARDNAVVSAPVYRLDGQRVATGYADIWDGSIENTINLTQNLTTVPGAQSELTWSGSTSAGVAHGTYPLGNGTESALTGRASGSGGGWIAGSTAERRGPGTSLRMYALSERITIETPPDEDEDGLPDWYELAHTDPQSSTTLDPADDSDQDGLTALEEYNADLALDPTDPDTDNDGLIDGATIAVASGDPRYTAWAAAGIAYTENAGVRSFRGETTVGTNPVVADTDADGLLDGVESHTGVWVNASNTGTDPLDPDTDNDVLLDGVETNTQTFVDKANTGTNPHLADSDNDNAGDWYEIVASFTDPNIPAERPNIPYPLPDPDNATPASTDKPVKVYILSGQSNMVGIGNVPGPKPGSLDAITKVDGKFPNLLDDSNNYLERRDVWYEGVVTATAKKWLAPGCGSGDGKIGPELGFGQVMGWYHDEPVIILKASEGNRSLGWDFLPPGSPQYTVGATTYAGYGDSPSSWPTGTTPVPGGWYAGKQYDDCFLDEADHAPLGGADIYNAADVLENFDTVFPQWAAQGYEIAGFFWFQGHKDGGQSGTGSPTVYATRYEENMGALIDALRAEFNAPAAPFVVATVGFDGGDWNPGSSAQTIWNAQMAVGDPVQHPEYAGTVASVDTTGYWRELAESPGSQGYHYNNNAETYMLIGDAAGRAMVSLIETDDSFAPTPDPMTFLIQPSGVGATSIGMVATTANDPSGPVEYYFENITTTSFRDWSTSPSWNETGLTNGQSYAYRVKARDSLGNETAWSTAASATAEADATAPSPNPMTFSSLPTPASPDSITMTASSALDISGVEYLFTCKVGGGPDSEWQDSRVFTPTGLTTGVTYTYVVRARDKSPAQNATADSAPASAAPEAIPDTTGPGLLSLDPADDANNVATNASLTLTFDEDVTAGSGSITVKNLTESTQTSIAITDGTQVSISGDTVTITPTGGFTEGRTYAVQVANGAITDLAGNPFSGIADEITWNFTIADPNPPVVQSFTPADNATGVSATADLVVTFNEPVVAGTGLITLKNLSDTTQSTIDITDGAQVSISGSTLTINPTASLAGDKQYAIRIASTAIEDLAGNAFAGIGDDTTWNFTTRLAQANVLDPDDPLVPDGVGPGEQFHFVFVTSTRFNRNGEPTTHPENINYYNGIVNGVADNSSIPAVQDLEWKAIVSTPDVDARDNAAVTAPVYLLNGTQVATGAADLWNGSIMTPIMIQENGVPFSGGGGSDAGRCWSGSTSAGVASGSYPMGTGIQALTGTARTNETSSAWITSSSSARRGVDSNLFYYALSEVITVAGGTPGNTFADWIAGYPGVGDRTGLDDDPDGDGDPNGVEAWFGTNPAAASGGIANLVVNGTTITFNHPQNTNPPDDLAIFYQWSPNLIDWYAGDGVDGPPTGQTVTVSSNTVDTTTTVTATASGSMDGLFLRLGVQRN
jgi:methionine-rich copper-binding protein CopC